MNDLKHPTEAEQLVVSRLRTLASWAPPFAGFTAPPVARPSQPIRRSWLVPLAATASVAGIALGVAAVSDSHRGPEETPGNQSVSASTATPTGSDHELSDSEIALAVSIAQAFIEREDASVTSGTATAADGTVTEPNASGQCMSGRLLHVQLIGKFPKIVTTGHPIGPDSPEDFTVRAVELTADPATGSVCLVAVKTGEVTPDPDATPLQLG